MPTLLGLCGLDIPDPVEGRDLSACVRDSIELDDHVALYMSVSPFSGKNHLDPAYRAIRTHRHTYVRTSEDTCYLFDDVDDPYQLRNLVGEPETAEIENGLAQKLKQQLEQIDDPFEEKEYYLDKWGYKVNDTGEVPYSR
jgi:arylsulfatase A-like enzyme